MNDKIKQAIKRSRFMQYEVAAAMGISECTLSKWFRKELTAEQQEKILSAIDRLKAGEANA